MMNTHLSLRRRSVLATAGIFALAAILPCAASPPRRERLLLAGPPAPVSFPLMRLVDSGALRHLARSVEFQLWKSPDQLRAMVVQGEVDFIATPSNVAANLYNRGAPLQLMDVSAWGLLWLVSRDVGKTTLADFKGEEITVPFRADMPDIVLQLLARQQGLDPARDFRLRYVASPFEAMQLLIARRTSHALLSEPAVSMALRKTRSFPVSVIAPALHRSVDMQHEWGRVLQRAALIPQAGIAVVGAAGLDVELLGAMDTALAQAHAWCRVQPEACGTMARQYAPMLLPEAVTDALQAIPALRQSARQARTELEFFYTQLLQQQPGLVGGKLPDDDFYL